MGLSPKIEKKNTFTLKKCARCAQSFGPESFAPTKSIFYKDGVIPICNDCVEQILAENGDNEWETVDKLCQMVDIPFVPKEWTHIKELSDVDVFFRYATLFQSSEYSAVSWKEYNDAYEALRKQGTLDEEMPLINEDKKKKLKEKWGYNYDDEGLRYLEELFAGLMSTQSVNGALQVDQALKICKMSYEIDRRIAEGEDFDKLLGSYDKMVKAAEFTPKNVKNLNDFDTFGEAAKWMEKNGWVNRFYDNVTRDIVDATLQDFENFNQRLYTNESNIGDEIKNRIESLKSASALENESYYDTNKEYDLDAYNQAAYNELVHDEEFKIDLDDEMEDK